MKKTYLLVGHTGEYSDYQHWNVCAYNNKKEAAKHLRKLDKWVERINSKIRKGDIGGI